MRSAYFLRSIPVKEALHLVIGAILMVVTSQIMVPFFPVPFTLQTLGIMVIGLVLTPGQAFLTTLLWITGGAMGLPVFAGFSGGPFVLLGPTGGYLMGMLVGAPILSWLFRRWGKKIGAAAGACTVGVAIWMTLGWMQLSYLLDDGYKAWIAGVAPFLLGEGIKVLLAVSGCYAGRRWQR